MEVIAWCIVTNHVHLVFRALDATLPQNLLGDFKRFTRKEMLLSAFKKAAQKSSNVDEYQFWRHDNKPIELWSNKVIREKVNYVRTQVLA